MTTLAKATPVNQLMGDSGAYPVVANEVIYLGSAVGTVLSTGHARPLTSVDVFQGFNMTGDADNSTGVAGAINVTVLKKGTVKLSVSGAVATDIGLPVYAQDDASFSFIKTGGVFIGFATQFVGAGIMQVTFNAEGFVDPHEGLVAETTAIDKTLDKEDTGKVIFVTADDKTITLPAVAAMSFRIVNAGACGTTEIDVAPNAIDLIISSNNPGTDNHGLVNTKATACRGDYLDIVKGDVTGWIVSKSRGIWADKDNS